ncbi:MAG: 16S rRNA (adenine(1518)-N(6)/adenine(1519)-N(6))-dimethyltransferase [Betaproteobacteria bacterium RBG_16_66_20]|nr:MAG: 16S rRNA (adenine(1518)-N(6)/adenine(1519)-N(6))-dimethyltransferase [Betaproteobacteria bacterium RBG_16_66_20]
MKTRKRFGQHFLHDPGVLKRIVEAIAPAPGDAIVEIGPGEGALTRPLLECVRHLTAIEIDRDLAARLAEEFAGDRLTVICADALDYDFSAFPSGVRIAGNLPYNISTPLLFHLARFADRVRDMHFMLQREVVERMVAKPSTSDYGRLSVMLQARFEMRKLFNVAPGAFRPPPKVDSAVVRLVPLRERLTCDETAFEKIVREAFSARRKTLRNALPLQPADYAELGIDPKLRPENLSPADYLRITKRVCAR